MAHEAVGTKPRESVEDFRARARAWIRANLGPGADFDVDENNAPGVDEESWVRTRELQRNLFDAGFAGIAYPVEYGGLGLTHEHQAAFNEEVTGYEMPLLLNLPSLTICGPTILDLGTEEQKKQHLPAMLRGDEIIVQFLSEPSGGSDLAGVSTRAEREGDEFVVNGSKIWSGGAYAADYALCLVRTNWDVPKHQGLTMLLMRVHQPGVEIHQIRQLNGNTEFCQEFFTDVRVPVSDVIGDVDGGWAVAMHQLLHERITTGGASPYVSGGRSTRKVGAGTARLVDLARRTHQAADPRVRDLIAESHVLVRVQEQLTEAVSAGVAAGRLPDQAGAMARLFMGEAWSRRAEIAMEVGGSHVVVPATGTEEDHTFADDFVIRQAFSLGGGSTEISRNVISERVLGMPREHAPDRDIPFREVKRGR